MVTYVLAVALLLITAPVWGQQPRQLCLSCHPAHYAERGQCSDCHRGNPASERKNIAHAGLRAGKYARFTINNGMQMREGERLLDQLACRRCHISAGRGNRLSVSLDVSASRKTAKELALSIRRPVTNMPNFGLEEGQITTLVNVIYAGSQGRQSADSAPVRVHFTANGTKSGDIFTAKCGSCHRILSERLGAVGNGDVGPNLSGLFSKYYPQTFRNGARWTDSNLRIWLKNSRDIRPQARMLPVILTKSETKELESVIRLSTDLTR